MIIPLYARKLCTEQFPQLFQDKAAVELLNRLDYDFSGLEKQSESLMQVFGALEVAMRQNDLAWEVTDYLREHPHAAVVNLGCGLDQAGVFYYFQKPMVKKLVTAMAEKFPGARMAFDACGKTALKLMMKTWIKQAEIQDVGAYFYVSDAISELSGWSPALQVSSRGYMLGYFPMDAPDIKGIHRLLAKIGDGAMKMQIVRIDFRKSE